MEEENEPQFFEEVSFINMTKPCKIVSSAMNTRTSKAKIHEAKNLFRENLNMQNGEINSKRNHVWNKNASAV